MRVQRHAAATGARTIVVRNLRVVPSARRFDPWPLWRILLMTNPLVILLLVCAALSDGWWVAALALASLAARVLHAVGILAGRTWPRTAPCGTSVPSAPT